MVSLGAFDIAAMGVAAGATGTARGAGEIAFGVGVSAGVADGVCFGLAFGFSSSAEGVVFFFLCAGGGLFEGCPIFFAGVGDFLCVFAAGEAEGCGRGVGLFWGFAFGFFGRGVGDSSADLEDSDLARCDFRKAARLRSSSSLTWALTSVAISALSKIAVIQRLEKRVTGADRIRAGRPFKAAALPQLPRREVARPPWRAHAEE